MGWVATVMLSRQHCKQPAQKGIHPFTQDSLRSVRVVPIYLFFPTLPHPPQTVVIIIVIIIIIIITIIAVIYWTSGHAHTQPRLWRILDSQTGKSGFKELYWLDLIDSNGHFYASSVYVCGALVCTCPNAANATVPLTWPQVASAKASQGDKAR